MSARGTRFDPQGLLAVLSRHPCHGRMRVAYSGGADSTALLAALAEARPRLHCPVEAVHVNHGVHPDADEWQARCKAMCARLGMPFTALRVQATADTPESPEAELRRLRYTALAGQLRCGDLLLTAHHREDQAETVLLHLMRGSGIEGIAGMPASRPLGSGTLVRPLLGWGRQALRDFLASRELGWIEDSTNTDSRFDRSYLRNEVLPGLRERWPAADAALARSAEHCRESSELLRTHTARWLDRYLEAGRVLRLDVLERHGEAALRALVREWLRTAGAPAVPRNRLQEFTRQLVHARSDAQPSLRWDHWALHRYADRLWLHGPGSPQRCSETQWTSGPRLDLSPGLGHLVIVDGLDGPATALRVRARRGGDMLRLVGRGHHTSVKELLRAAGMPPWLRGCVPMFEAGGEIVAVADFWAGAGLADALGNEQAELAWHPDDPVLAYAHRLCRDRAVASARGLG